MRGDTQVLNTIALGAPGDVQLLDTMQEDDTTKRYMHHYFDAPFTYGEAGFFRGPSRRAIGHGALAEKAILPVLPTVEDFPYAMRSVSEIMGSNGSSSMASTCASSMTLMAAGVPIKRAVAGIAMGLASESDANGTITRYKVLTDLQDVEDGEGGMDFKITGTTEGITAIQMDTKTKGLTWEIVDQTVKQSAVARKQILAMMATIIAEPRAELSEYAPRIVTLQINPEKIGDIIGPGGKTIKKIVEETGVDIDIEQDGRVLITSKDAEGTQKAIDIIKNLTREIEAGEIFEAGKVVRVEEFGAFVELVPGKDGLVHVSEISWERTDKVSDVLKLGDIVKVKVKEIDNQGRVALTIKGLTPKPEGYQERPPRSNDRGPRPGGNSRGPRPGGDRGPRPAQDGNRSTGGGYIKNSGPHHAPRPPHGDRPAHVPPAAAQHTYTDNPANSGAKTDGGKKKGLFGFGKKND
jgi:polyribonucleotide nucleotidyltransferase